LSSRKNGSFFSCENEEVLENTSPADKNEMLITNYLHFSFVSASKKEERRG
jgi:hypothetical protein